MKLVSSFILPALCWRLASASGHVYIYDPDRTQEQRSSRTLSPIAARLVLAQRGGVEEYHSTDLQNEEVIDAINDYGTRTPIFAGQKNQALRMLLYMEGENHEEYLNDLLPNNFAIDNDPSSTSASELFEDLRQQHLVTHVNPLSQYRPVPPDDSEHARAMSIKYIQQCKDLGTPLTILYMTPTPRTFGAGAEWGTYSMPPHLKREEKPLEQGPPQPVASTTKPNTLLSTSPLPGILPACYPSESTCNTLTRNCTGHGKCALKYIDTSPEPKKPCYACACSPTVREKDGKTQTTYWGGPACQKRDVSMQFWLLALFSVGMVGLVSFAVGQVMGMGAEELPSVIGAGVSGPVARR